MQFETINVACPACRRPQVVASTWVGGAVRCVYCQATFVVPASPSQIPIPPVAAHEEPEVEQPEPGQLNAWLGPVFLGSLGLLLLVVLVIGVMFAKGKLVLPKRKPSSLDVSSQRERAKENPVHRPSDTLEIEPSAESPILWSNAHEMSLIMHRVKLFVEHVEIGPVKMNSSSGMVPPADQQNYVTIFLSLKNQGEFPLDYEPWYRAGGSTHTKHRPATLIDNLGRPYPINTFPGPGRVRGTTSATKLRVGEEVNDVIVFSLPDEGLAEVKYFLLSLPTKAFGGDGIFRFEIPLENGRGW